MGWPEGSVAAGKRQLLGSAVGEGRRRGIYLSALQAADTSPGPTAENNRPTMLNIMMGLVLEINRQRY